MTWPIVGYDTDLWYHLSGGRYFWRNGTMATDAFFSFISPPKSWYDYYWMFQTIVYKVFQWTGYQGLVGLRCLLYFLTSIFICLFFVHHAEGRANQLTCLSFFICCTIALTTRELLVRPHLFSYLFIIVFLYILELRKDKIWLLPLLGIMWSNIHGYEYPVMIMILLAYLSEMYYQDFRNKSINPGSNKKQKWFLILSLYAVFFTPGVTELIKTPFNISYGNALYQQFYVLELIPFDFTNLLNFSVLPFSNLIVSFQHLLVIASIIFFMICLWKRSMRISHLVIFLCSLLLLIKHNRFIYEFILLSIPLVRYSLTQKVKSQEIRDGIFYRVAPVLMIFILIVVPLLTYGSKFNDRPAYPFTQTNLPTGIAVFLNKIAKGGSVLNEPNTGGYLQWALDKRYKIYMDMQLAIFSDRDFAYVNNALHDENAFRSFTGKYDPSFLSVSLNRLDFKELILKFPEYRPIFFDDTEALYVNARHYPQIADTYELKHIDPFQSKNIDFERETEERLSLMLNEATGLWNIYSDGRTTNAILVHILLVKKEYEKALAHAESIILRYPDIAEGYALKGDVFFGMNRFEEAAAAYKKAIEKGPKEAVGSGYKNLHVSYIRLKQYKKAYQVISQFVNPFNLNATYQDIYALAMSAASAGKLRDAVNFLKIAEMKLPPEDAEYSKKIKENLRMFDPEGKMENTQ